MHIAKRTVFRRSMIAVLIVAAVLVIARALLPVVMEHYVNRELRTMDPYNGAVADVDVALIRGEYALDDLVLRKRDSDIPEPFLSAKRIDLGLDWSAIWAGELVGAVHVEKPVLAFVDGPTPETSQEGAGEEWLDRLETLVPFQLNSLTVDNGTAFLYKTEESGTTERLFRVHAIDVVAENFTNIRESEEEVFGTVAITATVEETGLFRLSAEIDPLTDPPELSVDAEVTGLPLPSLNPLLEAYANLDAEAGRVEIFVEFASADGRFDGYVKPLVRDAEILTLDEEGSFFGKVWESVVEFAKTILENDDTERVGAEIPLEGELTAVDADLIPAVFSILRNAFIEALSVGLGHTIGLENVQSDDEGDSSS